MTEQQFKAGDKVVVAQPKWYGLPKEPATVTEVDWSVTFGNWSCRCEWAGRVCWMIQSDLRKAGE